MVKRGILISEMAGRRRVFYFRSLLFSYIRYMFPLLIVSLMLAQAQAASGQIAGVVYSKESGEPLPGTNILVKGTLLGAAADLAGEFRIDALPPGTYTLQILNIGYQSQELSVDVATDSVTQLIIELEPKAIRSPEIVVTGARRAMRKIDSPVTIATISAEDMSYRNAATVQDILPYESGVQLLGGQISMRGSSGYARGAGSRVIVLVDGFPAMSFDNGTIYWDAVPVQNIDRIEILKGPGSALYGSNAMGGVINIITKTMAPGVHTDVSFGGGIYSKPNRESLIWNDRPMLLEEWRVSHTRHFGALAAKAAIARFRSESYYENGWIDRWIFTGELDYTWQQNRLLRSRLYLVLDDHGSFTEWKSPYQPFHTPLNTEDDHIETHKMQWSTLYSHVVSPSQSRLLRLNLFKTRFDNYLHNNTGYSDSRTLNPEFQINLRPGGRHYISSGVDFKYHQVSADLWGNHRGLEAAAYFQDEVPLLSFLTVSFGARWDVNRVDDQPFNRQVNPKLGLTLDISKQLVLRASHGWAYRAPAMAEMFINTQQYIFQVKPNPDLQPETNRASEVGLYRQGRRFNLDLAVFSSDYHDLIEPIMDRRDQRIQFRNVTEARIQGGEATLDWVWQRLPLTGKISYTYLDPRDLSADDILAYRHRHTLVVSGQLILSKNFTAGADYRYLSRMERVQLYDENPDTGADQRVPVKLVSGFCQFSMDNVLRISLSVENLLQYYYVVVERNMGPVRLIKLRIDYTF
ncbi:MAG: TonB-dependent receptor [Fidelibacterota bacterium]